jgi:hypothetical protein
VEAGPGGPLPFDKLLVVAVNNLGLSIDQFWKITFGEFWPIYNAKTGKTIKPLSHMDLERLEERWTNGNA